MKIHKNEKKILEKVKIALLCMQRHSWEQGVAMQAFWEAGEFEITAAMSRDTVFRAIEDGRTAIIGTSDAITDPCATGEVLFRTARYLQDETMEITHQNLLNWARKKAPRNKEGLVYHMMSSKQFWVDSMYMLPPYLAAAGYPEEAYAQLMGYWSTLYDLKAGLMCHIWDDEQKFFLRKDHWGVGNGWAMAGIARVIDLMPDTMKKEKIELATICTKLIVAVSKYIRQDGLAHDILDNPETFVETNLPQMLAYTIYRGILSGWLPMKWKEKADTCRKACQSKMDTLGFIREVCGEPHFISPGIAPEGQAFFIMMEIAAEKLNRKEYR